MSDQQLAVREAQTLVHRGFDDPTRELIRKTVSDPRQPLTQDEFDLFIAVCQHTGLNPLLKEIYATKIDGRFTVLTGIDGYRKMAQSSRRFRGMSGPLWCGQDGIWRDAWLDQSPPTACKVGVYVPGVNEPTWGVAYFKNYRTRNTPTWKQMPEHMLAVRAEAFALRKVFGREIGAVALPADDEQWSPPGDGALDEPLPPSTRAPAIAAAIDATLEEVDAFLAEPVEDQTPFEQEQRPDTETGEVPGPRWQSTQLGMDVSQMWDRLTAANEERAARGQNPVRHLLPLDSATETEIRQWLAAKERALRALQPAR